ncbi:ArdC family protein [Aquidulcibacter paucihalophilus]|uniref:ArdC family protein n=1 Tax=Aquidulcibacter paucihalophilus TaxID=1978549 RepID=UPI0018E2E0BC|nr:zincin-like metallopeptidase domain-containing protein [Aquidulcibacter paucihalophilus]
MSFAISASRNSRISSASDEVRLTPHERVTAQISSLLERGVRPWIKPWDDIAPPDALVLPLRSCGTPYRGMNIIALWAAALESGFRSRHWFTFKQALAMKACVRKGERGSFVVYYAEVGDKSDGDGSPSRAPNAKGAKGEETGESRRILRGYTVFNAEQIDGLPETFHAPSEIPTVPRTPFTISEDETRWASLFARIPVTLRHGGNRAFYSKAADYIQMPLREAFRDGTQYWATLAHETAHASRHETRLNRDFGQTRFGDAGYALEELVAELASAFIGAHIGLPADHLEDHAAYINEWLKALGDNPSTFLTAASKAQAAADWVLGEMGAVDLKALP